MAWLTGYKYRKKITITGSLAGEQTNYQKQLKLHSESGSDSLPNIYLNNHCLKTMDDIRFTKADGTTLLDFWVENMNRHFAQNGKVAPLYPTRIGPSAIYYNGKTYIVWQGSFGTDLALYPMIACYTHSTKTWSGPVRISTSGLASDDHGPPAIMVDSSGYLHVAFGCHSGSMYYYRSTNTEDISAWTAKSNLANTASYPHWIKDSSGNLYIFYRGPNTYQVSYKKSTDGGANWSSETTVLSGTNGDHTIYYGNPVYDSTNGRIHLSWCVFNATAQERFDVYHCYLNLSDGHIYSMGGTDLGTQADQSEMDTYCKIVDTGSYESNAISMRLDENKRPHLIYPVDSADGWKAMYLYWNGSAWSDPSEITSIGHQFSGIDFICSSASDMIAYFTVTPTEVGGGSIEKWTWNGNSWSKETTILAPTDVRWNGNNYTLNCPNVVENYNSDLVLIFCEIPNEYIIGVNNPDGGFSISDKKLYAVNSNDAFVNKEGDVLSATVWVEIDSIPASPDTIDVYVYYDKSDATNASSITGTFANAESGATGNFSTATSGNPSLSRSNQAKYVVTEDSVDDAFILGLIYDAFNKRAMVLEWPEEDYGAAGDAIMFGWSDVSALANLLGSSGSVAGLRRFFIARYSDSGTYTNNVFVGYYNAAGTLYTWNGSLWNVSVNRFSTSGVLTMKIWDDGSTFYADILKADGSSVFANTPSIAMSSVKSFSNGKCLGVFQLYTDTYYPDISIKDFFVGKYVSPEPVLSSIGEEEEEPTSYAYEAEGGAILGGQIAMAIAVVPPISGGAMIGGSPLLSFTSSQESYGGVIIGGEIDLSLVRSIVAVGGLIIGGEAGSLRSININSLSGCLSGGLGMVHRINNILAQGGAVAGGKSLLDLFKIPGIPMVLQFLFPQDFLDIDRYDEATQDISLKFMGDDFNQDINPILGQTSSILKDFKKDTL